MAKLKSVSPARRAAFEILREVEAGAFSSILLAAEEPKLKASDRALTHELVLGVLRWQLWLDKLADHYSKRTADGLDPPVRLALRLGLYQLRFLSRIPASAAVNESVNLVRGAGVSSAAAFVNAVLRRAIREADFDPAEEATGFSEKLSIVTSHPVWLIERWVKSFGRDETEAFARANNAMPPTSFRVVKGEETEIADRLREAGALVEPSRVAEGAWRVSGASSVVRDLAANGEVYLQDEASQLVAQSVSIQPGERALDLCAAPGGKTTLIAQRAGNTALVVAGDRSERRLETVATTSALHNLSSIKLVLLDAAELLPFADRVFDRILVDAPCSGTGTLRRNPEIRWRISEAGIQTLAEQQKLFLKHAARVLKPGAQLVYSTCSVEPDENEAVVRDFLEVHQNFRQLRTLRTWPHREGSDGFFLASFQLATQQ
ncbi:MAG TPA: 16S rRNA (cytosine(967)-C(5))-methyltransferase RsmB [Pyrinomonadaceae bacterium]